MTRSTLFNRNHSTVFLIKRRRATDATSFLSKKLFVKISYYSQENNWQVVRPAILLKRDSNIDVFLQILGNFLKTLYFEEHLLTAASEETFGSDCLELSF